MECLKVVYLGICYFVLLYTIFILISSLFYKLKSGDKINIGKVICLVPVHNEELILSETISNLKKEFKIIICVLDSCSDDSYNICLKNDVGIYEVNFKNKDKAVKYALSMILKNYYFIDGVFLFDADSRIGDNFKEVYKYIKTDRLNFIAPSVKNGGTIWERFAGVINSFFVVLNRGFMVVFGRGFVGGYGLFIPVKCIPEYIGFESFTNVEDLERLKFKCNFIDIKNVNYCDYAKDFKGFFYQRLRWFIGSYYVFFYRFKDIVKSFYLLPIFLSLFMLPISLVIFVVDPISYILNSYMIMPLYVILSRNKLKFVDLLLFPFMMLLLSILSLISLMFKNEWYSARYKEGAINEKVIL